MTLRYGTWERQRETRDDVGKGCNVEWIPLEQVCQLWHVDFRGWAMLCCGSSPKSCKMFRHIPGLTHQMPVAPPPVFSKL